VFAFCEFGGPDVWKIEDVAVPDLGLHEVRLRIKAFGLNRSEILTRSGVGSLPLWSKQ
jgi:NADPH:quinone reductase-like Zn-dependent oxidoreductase